MADDALIRERIASVPHWYHRFELAPGIVTPGTNDCGAVLAGLDLPARLDGARALDLGTRDGFFAFELERRGADVTAVDYVASHQTGFRVAAEIFGSKVAYVQENVYNLRPASLGTFDLVLFLGLLYHLPDPLAALAIVRSLCRDTLFLETQVIDNAFRLQSGQLVALDSLSKALSDVPLMQFYPGDALCGDPTNYWAPNLACLEGMLAEANFRVLTRSVTGARALLRCAVTHDERRAYFLRIAQGSLVPGTRSD
jgi:tRNA (mo5U34)-methyltransferase